MAEEAHLMRAHQDAYNLSSEDGDDQTDYNVKTGIMYLNPQEQVDYIRSRGINSQQYFEKRDRIGKYFVERCLGISASFPAQRTVGDERVQSSEVSHSRLTIDDMRARGWVETDVPPRREEISTYVRMFKDLQGFYQKSSNFLEFSHDSVMKHYNRRSIWTHADITETSNDLPTARPIIHCIYPQRLLISHDFQNPRLPVLDTEASDHGQPGLATTCWDDLAFAQWRACSDLYKRGEAIRPPNWVLIRSIRSLGDAAFIRSCITDSTDRLPAWPGKTFFAGVPGFEALFATAAGKANAHLMFRGRGKVSWINLTCLSITAFAMPNEDMPSLLFHWTDRTPDIEAAQRSNMAYANAKASGEPEYWLERNHPMTKMLLRRGTGPGSNVIIPDVVV